MVRDEVPSQSLQQVLNCQYQEWYPLFKSVSFRSEIIPLPKAFVTFLMDDGGVFLPDTSDALPKRYEEDEFSGVDNSEYRAWGEGPGSPTEGEDCMQINGHGSPPRVSSSFVDQSQPQRSMSAFENHIENDRKKEVS